MHTDDSEAYRSHIADDFIQIRLCAGGEAVPNGQTSNELARNMDSESSSLDHLRHSCQGGTTNHENQGPSAHHPTKHQLSNTIF